MRKRISIECPDQLYLDFDVDINDVVEIMSCDYDVKTGKPVRDNKKEIRL